MGPNFTPLSVPHSPAPPPNRKKPFNKNAFALVAAVVLLVGVVSGYFLMQSGLFYKSRAASNFDDTVKDTSVSAVNPQNPPLCDTCDPPLPVSTSKTIDTTSQTAGKWVSDYLCGSNSTPNPWCYLVKDNLTLKVGPGKIKIIITARHWNSGPDGDEGFRVISSVFNGNLVHPQSTTIEKEYSSPTDIAFVFDHSVYPSGSVQATVDWVYTPPVTPTKTPTPPPRGNVPSCPSDTTPLFSKTQSLNVGTIVEANGKVTSETGGWIVENRQGLLMATEGNTLTIEFPTQVIMDTVLIYDNDPKTGEKPWSINGKSLPVSGQDQWGPAYKFNETSNKLMFDYGGDSPHFTVCIKKISSTSTPKPSNTPPPTATLACPKPNPVKNLRINCPICKGS